MSTIAEKINYITQDLAVLREDIQRLDRRIKDIIAEAEPKPADPEPLECWVNVYPDPHHNMAHVTYEDAIEAAMPQCNRRGVHTREVTPQMLENEKDAARFRRLMEMDGVGWQEGGEGWTALVPGRVLREEVDKEMEDK